ncbi:CU044_5270 family protein [Streptomyces arboris]|uniref:CU044_5270 family protein n=1 Tax=Streptomyces arboris TaxID=2600619 RepID=UPI003C2AFA2F
MDEMTQLRELRADAPVPDRAALAPGRERLTDAIAGNGGRRTLALRLRLRLTPMLRDWRVASLGAVVAVTAAALVITQVVGVQAPDPTSPATVAGDLDLTSPAAALNRAADYLERQEVPPEPRRGQWIYTREVDGASGNAEALKELQEAGVEVPAGFGPERWVPYDDKAAENDGSDTDFRTARESYRIAAALPEDPEALLAKLRETFPTGDETIGEKEESEDAHSFRAVSVLLRSYPLPPDAMARIYRALATVRGVKVTHHLVEDAAGRQVIAVVRQEHMEFTRTDLLIDPVDYSYAGTREVVVESFGTVGSDEEPAEQREPGDVLIDIARIHAAVVDAEGEKP